MLIRRLGRLVSRLSDTVPPINQRPLLLSLRLSHQHFRNAKTTILLRPTVVRHLTLRQPRIHLVRNQNQTQRKKGNGWKHYMIIKAGSVSLHDALCAPSHLLYYFTGGRRSCRQCPGSHQSCIKRFGRLVGLCSPSDRLLVDKATGGLVRSVAKLDSSPYRTSKSCKVLALRRHDAMWNTHFLRERDPVFVEVVPAVHILQAPVAVSQFYNIPLLAAVNVYARFLRTLLSRH